MLIGTLGGVELGLVAAGVPFKAGGVTAAMDVLSTQHESATARV
jgi:alanine-glyoxylate transaminase/serine-glyoxylate transaminase/serine-pyruvate transaminase